MSKISFEQVYGDDKNLSLSLFLLWANDFLDGLETPDKNIIDLDAAFSFVTNLRKDDFPASGGYDKASPFKKAANVYVWLHALSPFKSSLPKECVGADMALLSHNTASFVGFALVKTCLHGVSIQRTDGTAVVLANPISLSKHFMHDLVESSAGITPLTHFKVYSLLFEALAYEANSGICYQKVF